MQTLTITRPDDWHVHLRDGELLAHTVPAMARYFGRAIIMPNLVPPAVTPEQVATIVSAFWRSAQQAQTSSH